MNRIERVLSRIFVCLLSVAALFTFLECAARLYLTRFASERQFLKYASYSQLESRLGKSRMRYAPHRYLGYYPSPGYRNGNDRHNALGYRGEEICVPKPSGEYRIVCMGGSTTYTTDILDYRQSYPFLLEKKLRSLGHRQVTVVNAGAGMWSTFETLINFELRVLDLEPDMVVVYHAINDVHTRLVWPPQAYVGDNSGARSANTVFMPSFVEYSTLLRLPLIKFGVTAAHSGLGTIDRTPSTFYADDFRMQKLHGTYPSGIFTQTSAKEMLATNTPRYYERNLRNIMAIARERNIRVILATFAYSPLFEEYPYVSSDEYRGALDEMNDSLKKVAAETDVTLFDFAGVFPKDKRYYTDGRHVTVEGADLKAKLFAEFIHQSRLIPPPTSGSSSR